MEELFDFTVIKTNDDIRKSVAYIAKEATYKSKHMDTYEKKPLFVSKTDIVNAYKSVLKRVDYNSEIGLYERRMIDNFYLFEQQIKNLSFSLPKKQLKLLPRMTNGKYKGLPRAYAIVSEILSIYNCKIDEDSIVTYIELLQKDIVLEMEELDVLKNVFMLRLINICALIAKEEEKDQLVVAKADKWAQVLKNIVAENALFDAVTDMGKKESINAVFVSRIYKHFNETDKQHILDIYSVLLENKGIDINDYLSSVKNESTQREDVFYYCIESIRNLNSMPFDNIYESLCMVETELKKDEVYKSMDDASRQFYRRRIELLARKINASEIEIAKKAVELSLNNIGIEGHVGYYLVDDGEKSLYKELGFDYNIKSTFEKFNNYRNAIYFISIIFAFYSAYYIYFKNYDIFFALLMSTLLFLPFYTIVQRVLNDSVLRFFKPNFLPKINLKELGSMNKTVVISPRVITDKAVIDEAIKDLETYYIANEDEHIYFVLLGDFPDSKEQISTKDIKLIEYAASEIKFLNKKYERKQNVFYYLQRSRGLSETQNMYIPPDRKRGSIEYFNNFMLKKEGAKEKYAYISNELPDDIPYVITLDSDTRLILGSVKKLIGTIIHPLNRPILDEDGNIKRGYGIIQPRISTDVISAGKSVFSNLYCGQTGLDVYSSAVSDVYMDLFGEGIFTGKGLYVLKAFSSALKNKIENETILSHDLLEGIITRVGYASDIQLADGFPMTYTSFMKRQHRWIRGDWQLLPFLKKDVRDNAKISNFGAFKIRDNLFRSLLPACVFLLILLAMFSNSGVTAFVVVVSLLSLFINVILDFFSSAYVYATSYELKANARDMLYESKVALMQSVLNIAFLPYTAYINLNAVIKTLYRLTFTRKNMLEWNTFASVEKKEKNNVLYYFKSMIIAPIIGVFVLAGSFFLKDTYVPFVILGVTWISAPIIAYIISQKTEKESYALSENDISFIRNYARRTWAYFEDYVNEESSFLIPDNFQYMPNKNVAYRSSPTNIGLSLVSIIAANDMGFLDPTNMQSLIENVLSTIETLKKWNGHLYNWYDTKTLEPLSPYFISSVDSGNLASYMILCANAIQKKLYVPLIEKRQIEGMLDTLSLCEAKYAKLDDIKNRLVKYKNDIEKEISIQSIVSYISLYSEIKQLNINDQWIKKATISAKGYYDLAAGVLCYLQPLEILKSKLQADEQFNDIIESIADIEDLTINNFSIDGLIKTYPQIVEKISYINSRVDRNDKNIESLVSKVQSCVIEGRAILKKHKVQAKDISSRLNNLFEQMDFRYVYDNSKQLFAIGYNLEEGKLSSASYDMLASEARQTSFLAIAKGEISQKHWFKLARSLTMVGSGRILVSWGGTMFEYLMPLLTMKTSENTILGETYKSLIDAHISYGRARNVPWGVSESGFYKFDSNMYYQYKAFGLPKTGLKSGLSSDTVIAPYATCMALMVNPKAAIENMKTLQKNGALGKYGFYEALDYTKSRLYGGKRCLIVKSFMAHHLGMSFLAFDNVINNNIMQYYFHSIPNIRATQSLLGESIPARNVVMSNFEQDTQEKDIEINDINCVRTFDIKRDMPKKTHFISNGEYTIYLNSFGGGQSLCNGIALNRFRGDSFTDTKGIFFFMKNVNTKDVWSASAAPLGNIPKNCIASFEEDRAIFTRIDGDIKTKTEICVLADKNAEIRKITLTNNGNEEIEIELTSFLEVSLCPVDDDWSHAQFHNLFVAAEFNKKSDALIFTRRKRSQKEKSVYLYNKLIFDGETSYECSRAEFIARGKDISDPIAIDNQLKNSSGVVIDPCAAIRKRIKIAPNKSEILYYVLGLENEEDEALKASMINGKMAEEAFTSSRLKSSLELSHLGLTSEALEFANMLKDYVFTFKNALEKETRVKDNIRPLSALWRYGISGHNPLILCYAKGLDQFDSIISLLKIAEYYSVHGIPIDFVIINKEEKGYYEPLREKLASKISSKIKKCVFLINTGDIEKDDIDLLETISRVVFDCKIPLDKQLKEYMEQQFNDNLQDYMDIKEYDPALVKSQPLKQLQGQFDNGFGKFISGGEQYIIDIKSGKVPPMPYSNILSNANYGIVVNEGGICFSYAENSRENKLTRFENDSIDSFVSQAVYVRDNDSLIYNSISREPIKREAQYRATHGRGYTVYECSYNGLYQKQTVNVDMEKMLTYINVSIKNTSDKKRDLSIFYYADLLLGVDIRHRLNLLYAGYDNGILYAKNTETAELSGVAFAACPGRKISFTCNKDCFIGNGRSMKNPNAMFLKNLDNRTGIENCCFGIKTDIELEAFGSEEIYFVFGYEHTIERAEKLTEGLLPNFSAELSLKNASGFWDEFCGRIKVTTPDDSFNILVNNWLPYQILSSRVWARTGFYQVGGAYGFRDQLQDMLSIMLLDEKIARKFIINFAAHQFEDGDVQHWWHEPAFGVRTHIKDDLLFLPYTVAGYVLKTGDDTILNESVHYLKNVFLDKYKEDVFVHAKTSELSETIHEHCKKAIERAFDFGEHGLPLMGGGDWNDGMNMVGIKGKGESVWLGFFLYDVLNNYTQILKLLGEQVTIDRYEKVMSELKAALNSEGWDGTWFRRAYYDDGTPLGSINNEECKIDCVSQAFSVISGATTRLKGESAMDSVYKILVDKENGILKLLWPAFDKCEQQPGYIKGYNPGIRENGGQYTHGAIWAIIAFAKLKQNDRAYKLFEMINPINHTKTELDARKYKGEPYVMAADVYDANGLKGRSGWTWYTGSASWMYKTAVEDIIGFKRKGDTVIIDPCLPKHFTNVNIEYKYLDTIYKITIENKTSFEVNNNEKIIKLINDKEIHNVIVRV